MAVRYIGDVRVVVTYSGQTDGDRAGYECRLRTEPREDGSRIRWRCSIITPPGGPRPAGNARPLPVDSPEAYDDVAETAIMFATATSDEAGDGPCPELACAFEEATASAWEGKKLLVRRSK